MGRFCGKLNLPIGRFFVYNHAMTKLNIHKIAKLSNLSIPEERLGKLENQLEQTLKHIERLQNIDTSRVTGTNSVTNLSKVARDDSVEPSLTQEEALQNAKKTYNGFFVVPVILEEAVE